MAKKNSSKWWEQNVANTNWNTYNSIEEKNKDLLGLYMDASCDIKEELYSISEKYSKDGVLTLSDMHKQKRLTNLNKKMESTIEELTNKVEKLTVDNMQEGFETVYKNVGVQLGNTDFSMLNQTMMDELLERPWLGSNYSNRLWKNATKLTQTLNSQLLVGLQQGKTITEIAVGINRAMGSGLDVAHRLARTETMHYLNDASLQRYKDCGIEWVQVIAAEDERTCPQCGMEHERYFRIDKCPILPLHPNCRCTIIPVTDKDIVNQLNQLSKDNEYDAPPIDINGETYRKSIRIHGFSEGSSERNKLRLSTMYLSPDGVKFIFPIGMDSSKQTMTPEKAIKLWQKVPKEVRKNAQKTIEFVDYYNPQDEYWKKHYKNFKRSYATGGNKITFYRYEREHDSDYVVRTYCHESAHYIDRHSSNTSDFLSSDKEWTDAMESDKIESGKDSPTKYGLNSNKEDFAESVAEYVMKQEIFKSTFPNRALIIHELIGL